MWADQDGAGCSNYRGSAFLRLRRQGTSESLREHQRAQLSCGKESPFPPSSRSSLGTDSLLGTLHGDIEPRQHGPSPEKTELVRCPSAALLTYAARWIASLDSLQRPLHQLKKFHYEPLSRRALHDLRYSSKEEKGRNAVTDDHDDP